MFNSIKSSWIFLRSNQELILTKFKYLNSQKFICSDLVIFEKIIIFNFNFSQNKNTQILTKDTNLCKFFIMYKSYFQFVIKYSSHSRISILKQNFIPSSYSIIGCLACKSDQLTKNKKRKMKRFSIDCLTSLSRTNRRIDAFFLFRDK